MSYCNECPNHDACDTGCVIGAARRIPTPSRRSMVEITNDIVGVREALYDATGSALLAREKCKAEDARIIYEALCRANNVLWTVVEELQAFPSERKPTGLRVVVGRLIEPDGTEDVCDQEYVAAQDAREIEAALSAIEPPHPRTFDLMDYIDALFVSGNEVPVTSTLLSKASWDIICEMCEEGLALDYHVVEAEAVYRRKLAAYGDETRATSPLKAWKEKHLGI